MFKFLPFLGYYLPIYQLQVPKGYPNPLVCGNMALYTVVPKAGTN